jgi:hypothetical protein
MADMSQPKTLKEKFNFGKWQKRGRRIRVLSGVSAGLENPPPGWSKEKRLVKGPNRFTDYWQNISDPNQRVMVSISTHKNESDAHHDLLAHLSAKMAPNVPALSGTKDAVGDVAFGTFDGSHTSVNMVRHNISVHICSIGDTQKSVVPLATWIDGKLRAMT